MKLPVKMLTLLLAAAASAAQIDVIEGAPASTVKVTIYGDLQCNYCQSLRTMLDDKLLPRYGKQVAFVHRDLPLGRHDWARAAAMAARWVFEHSPRLGIIFRRELLDEQEHITAATLKPWVTEFAGRNKLSEQGITTALTDVRLGSMVDADVQMATTRGIKKIPTVIVGSKSFAETIVYDDLAKAIDEILTH